MNIWEFNRVLSRRLFLWNVVNIWVGTRLQRRANTFWASVGSQAVGWGIINVGIAFFGNLAASRRFKDADDPYDAALMRKDAKNLRRVLIINTGLDLLYMLGGYNLARTRGKKDASVRGTGWGIVLQGAFLCIFDLIHIFQVPRRHKSDR